MIDPKLLTEENGFVEGCVVEVVRDDGVAYYAKLHSADEKAVFVTTPFGDIAISMLEDISSTRPLTGPMAIWNFAPQWAEWAIIYDESILWGMIGDNEGSGIPVYRPFWAKETK
jgi:hypothetical protein